MVDKISYNCLPHLHRRSQTTNTTTPSFNFCNFMHLFIIYPKDFTWIHPLHFTMPGSIQVSVLDFKELPSSSNSVKFSLGKVEHEAGEMGSFSFPLANLRDNLIITVQDSEGNQVSQSGIRTMSIIEKGIWDDVFPIEGGGLIHMKLQFFLSEEERNRIRLMRESAMKKKRAEILGSRHELSQNVIDKKEETSFPHMIQKIEQKTKSSDNLVEKLHEETLKENPPNDVKDTNKESTLDKNNAILLRQAEVTKKLLEDTKTGGYLKNNNAGKSEPLDNRVEKLDKQILEDKNPSFVKKMSKESKFPPLAKETVVNTIKNNEIQLQETDLLKRLKDSSSSDVGSSRLTVAEKMKSFSPKLAGEMDKRSSLEKIPQNIKKMISVFESSIYQDGVPLKPVSAKSYRFGNSRLLKDYYEKSSSLKNSEDSSLSRLRNSFSTGDLRKSLSNIITEGDQVDVEINDEENLPKSPHEDVNDAKESVDGRKTSKFNLDYFNRDGSGWWTFLDERRQFCMTAQGDKAISLLSDCKIEEKGQQEKIATSIPEIVAKDEEIESLDSADVEDSNGSFGQAMKIALVVGFGVLVFLFRQRESGKGKKKYSLRNKVFMNKRGSMEEKGRTFGVPRIS